MMNGIKTYIGIIIAVAPTLAGLFGFDLSPQFGEQFTSLAMDVITIGGAAYALYGRAVAVTPGWFARRQ